MTEWAQDTTSSSDSDDGNWNSGRVHSTSDGETLSLISTRKDAMFEYDEDTPEEDRSKRRKLRIFISLIVFLELIFLIGSILLLITSYSFIQARSPVYLSPYVIESDNFTSVQPCVFPRLVTPRLPSDIECIVYDDQGGNYTSGYCPSKWACSTLTNPRAPVCLNLEVTCPDTNYCYNFVSSLFEEESGVRTSNVDMTTSSFITALAIIAASGILWVILGIVYAIWIRGADPLAERMGWDLSHLDDRVRSILESRSYLQDLADSSTKTLAIILLSIGVVSALVFSMMVFVTAGLSPSLPALTGDSHCVVHDDFYGHISALMGWFVVLTVALLVALFTQAVFVAMYNMEQLYRYWKPNLFFFVAGIFFVAICLGVIVEVGNAIA